MSDAHVPVPAHELPVDPDVEAGVGDQVNAQRSSTRQAGGVLASRWDVLLVVAVGGALGSIARWGLGQALDGPPGDFPWATFVENLTGGFALAILMVFVTDVWPPSRYVRPFFGVGVLGGYTTFSTYMLDSLTLATAGRAPLAAVYLFGTLAAGLAAVWTGIFLARLLVERGHQRRSRRRNPDHDGLNTRRQP